MARVAKRFDRLERLANFFLLGRSFLFGCPVGGILRLNVLLGELNGEFQTVACSRSIVFSSLLCSGFAAAICLLTAV